MRYVFVLEEILEEENSKTSKRLHKNVKISQISHIRYNKYCQASLILFKKSVKMWFYIFDLYCYCRVLLFYC